MPLRMLRASRVQNGRDATPIARAAFGVPSEGPARPSHAGDAPAHGWRSSILPAQWLKGYRRAWLRHDAVTGITLAAYAIPVFLAYASLAGLPPQHGVYCYLVAGVAYALFGTSRQLAIGPTSAK